MTARDVIGQGGNHDPYEADGDFAEALEREDRARDRHMTLNIKTAPGADTPGA